MSLHSISVMVVAPLVLVTGAVILLTPKDILRQPVLPAAELRSVPSTLPPPIRTADIAVVEFETPMLLPASLVVVASAPSAELITGTTGLPASADRRYITARSLNIRTGPKVSAELLASLPFGTPVNVIETSGTWAHVQAGDFTGWLSANFLTTSDPSAKVD